MAAAHLAEVRTAVWYPMASAVSMPAAVLVVEGLTAALACRYTPAEEFALPLPRECLQAAATVWALSALPRVRTSRANHSWLLRLLCGRLGAPRERFL